jgi:hypothetical protein
VRPLRSEALEELIAEIGGKPFVKKPPLRAQCLSVFQKGKNRVVARIQSMPPIDLLRRATKTTSLSEDFPQLGFIRL